MAVSIDDIKKLKELTGVGLTDAKTALVEADGDFDKALDDGVVLLLIPGRHHRKGHTLLLLHQQLGLNVQYESLGFDVVQRCSLPQQLHAIVIELRRFGPLVALGSQLLLITALNDTLIDASHVHVLLLVVERTDDAVSERGALVLELGTTDDAIRLDQINEP